MARKTITKSTTTYTVLEAFDRLRAGETYEATRCSNRPRDVDFREITKSSGCIVQAFFVRNAIAKGHLVEVVA